MLKYHIGQERCYGTIRRKNEYGMGGEQGTDHMKMMWEKLDEKTKKMVMSRMLDEKIMMKEAWIRHLQHKIETMKMIKAAMDKM